MVWPFKSKQRPAIGSSASALENPKLKAALKSHESLRTPQSHLLLLQELNTARYLIAAQDDEVKFIINKDTGLRTVDPTSKFKFLLGSSPDGQPLFTLFTDYAELALWAKEKATASWVMSSQEAWAFATSMSVGVIVNPSSAGWVMGKESIEWLQKHPL